ncbi:unnamed protein product [Pedinophyceae sp. YPF-701]|nr:unnamed protein product [Pedinophyceae sp. YPF-701]
MASMIGRVALPARCSGSKAVSRRGRLCVTAATTIPSEFKTVAPVGERVFVKIADVEDVSQGGILLPGSAQKRPTAGEVVSAATDCRSVKAGDRIVYSKFAGTEVEMGDDEYVVLKEDDCIGLMGADDIRALKPLGDRLLLEVAEAESKTAGGVLMAAGDGDKPTIGKVVAAGPGRKGPPGEKGESEVIPIGIDAGASVLYSKYAGVEFAGEDGREYIVVKESDILAVLS